MQQNSYLKCPCQKCGAHIEFPAQGLGQLIVCPHCNQNTNLILAARTPAENSVSKNLKSRQRMVLISLGCLGLVAALAVGIFAARKNSLTPPEIVATQPETEPIPMAPVKIKSPKPAKKTFAPAVQINDFEAVHVALEKTTNSRLIFATGTIRNKTERQRFGVKVELELFDAQETKIGLATDYVPVIEPGKEWKVRALVTERDATRANVISITEN